MTVHTTELDTRGLNCPLPILKAKKALAEMASGAYPALPARSLADFRSVDGVTSWLARVATG